MKSQDGPNEEKQIHLMQKEYPFEIHPVEDGVSIVHLARALSYISGSLSSFPESAIQNEMISLIGSPENVVFILVDGLGAHFVDALEENSFFRKNMVTRLNSVFPSTTASALTTFATGLWPSQHGITGWWTYFPEIGEPVTVLPFQRKLDNKPVEQLGITSESLFVGDAYLKTSSWKVTGIIPQGISASVFSRFAMGGNTILEYDGLEHGFHIVPEVLGRTTDENFVYLYIPDVDGSAHKTGITSDYTQKALADVQLMAERLCSRVRRGTRVIISADHGHLEATEETKVSLFSDGISHMLESEPSGDARVLYFRSKPGFSKELAEVLTDRCGDDYIVMSSMELEKSGILGPDMNDLCRSRLGDTIIISKGLNVVQYGIYREQMGMLDLRSSHSGLTRQEIEVPLIVL